ncbi:PEP-CTERM sorting domain-containing protein [Microcystis aeruginosa]
MSLAKLINHGGGEKHSLSKALLKSFSLATVFTTTLVLSSVSSAEAFTIFTNRTAWQAAVDAIAGSVTTTDTFSNNIASAKTITLDSGIVSANSFPPAAVNFGDNGVSGGLFRNTTDGGAVFSSETITWTFPSPVFAFGADFTGTNPDRLNLTGNFDGTGNQTLLVNNSIGGANGFLGIIGNANFSSIVFGNNTTNADSFEIAIASFASVASVPVAVPEPGMITGLVFLGGGLVVRRLAKRR